MFIKIISALMLLNVSGVRLLDDSDIAPKHIVFMITNQCSILKEGVIDVNQVFNCLPESMIDRMRDTFPIVSDPAEKVNLPACITFAVSNDSSLLKLLVIHVDKASIDQGSASLYKGDEATYKIHTAIKEQFTKPNGNEKELMHTMLRIMASITNAESGPKRKKAKPFFEFISGEDLLKRGDGLRYLNGDEKVPWANIFKSFVALRGELED